MRRDTLEKTSVALCGIDGAVTELLDTIQIDMLVSSRERRDKKIVDADTLDGILKGV